MHARACSVAVKYTIYTPVASLAAASGLYQGRADDGNILVAC